MKAWMRRLNRRRAIAGFTLLEILVVLIIIGVLVAIAAPSWSALLNRQRVNVVRDEVSQVIRQAQAEAKRTKLARVVALDTTSANAPRIAAQRQPLGTDERTAPLLVSPLTQIGFWQPLGQGEAGKQVILETHPSTALGQIVFDAKGAVDPVSVTAAQSATIGGRPYLFAVNVRPKGTASGANRCLIVDTLLGATRTAEGTDCPT